MFRARALFFSAGFKNASIHSLSRPHLLFAALALALVACGAPSPDASSADGLQQILDAVDVDLTHQDCTDALSLILPVYNSSNTSNDVRMRTASAYGCAAGINFFGLTQELTVKPQDLLPPNFWALMVQLFPSETGQDSKMEAAFYGTDSLQSVLNSGVILLPTDEVNAGGYNVGSVFATDRTLDSNLYLLYMAMAGMGTVESRYGTNNGGATTTRANLLPWTTAAAVNADGCGLAASVLNFLDAFEQSGSSLPSEISSVLTTVVSDTLTGLDEACAAGCSNTVPSDPINNPNGTWVSAGCAATTPCSSCPNTLRNRSSCTGVSSDVNSCAAAGLINFINSSALGWQS
jgi:hypothetical protein